MSITPTRRARQRGSTTAATVVAQIGQNPPDGQSHRDTTSAIMPADLRSTMEVGI